MRIITGTLKGRRLNPTENLPVRPTTDMARESLFNILNNFVDYEELSVLDLFSGTGAISFEFVSRGAKDVTAIEINPKCVDFIKKTAQNLNVNNLHVVRADVFDLIKRVYKKFDLVFADPPYQLETLSSIPNLIFEKELLKEDGVFVLEHSKEHSFEDNPYFWQHRKYGKVNFTFFRKTVDE